MEFLVNTNNSEDISCDCLIVAVHSTPSLVISGVDSNTNNILHEYLSLGDLDEAGSNIVLHKIAGMKAARIALINFGKLEDLSKLKLQQYIQKLITKLNATKVQSIHFCFNDIAITSCMDLPLIKGAAINGWSLSELVARISQWVAESVYSSDYLRTKQEKTVINKVSFAAAIEERDEVEQALHKFSAIHKGLLLTKELADLPSNVCNPSYIETKALELAGQYDNLSCEVIGEEEIKSLGMGAFAAVSQGSDADAKLIILHYTGAPDAEKPYVILGKGVTFDTGGISIKPSRSMEEMKYDMCGAASVFGTMASLAQLKPNINVIGMLACTENMPSGKAIKPGDIITSLSGQTIEIINTDAEGRLVLCDCLTYAEKYKPQAVIDIATLTGAVVVALGSAAAALYSNNSDLADQLQASAVSSGNKVWLMPLWEEYQEDLESNFADLANCGQSGRAGSISAACFLEKFAPNYSWAHLDIAGVAWTSGKHKHATGHPVSLLVNYLLSRQ